MLVSLVSLMASTCPSCHCTLLMTHLGQESNQSSWPTLSFAKGTIELFLCIFAGRFIAVQSVINWQDAAFPLDFPGFFENIVPSPFKRNFDFTPFDTIFSSWQSRTPAFHMLAELPPISNIPKVEVYCDESKMTVLVDKRSSGLTLTGEDIQLGDGCYSNGELPNRYVFTYNLDECGTARVMQNGMAMFTNSVNLNLKNPLTTWWQTPPTVHIYCVPKRSYANPDFFVSTALPENDKTFNMKAMDPSWTGTAESNIYKRGQVVNLRLSAKARAEEQLFIQSCFVSTSPEPQTRPRHAVIMNKGCTAPLGSPHAVVQFVASNSADVVNFVLNTSYLISELYVHCSVLLSDQGVTFGSKSCNYNVIQSRWEDLSGTAEVCECCSSKCRGLSAKSDAKAVVSAGPFVIVDKDVAASPEPSVSETQESSSAALPNSIQFDASDGAATEDTVVPGASIPRSKFSSPPQGAVVVSQDPVARLTLWLPGQVQDTEHSEKIDSESEGSLTVQLQTGDTVSNDLPEQESLNMPTNLNFLTLVDWIVSLKLGKAAIAEDPQRETWSGFALESPQEADIPLPDEMTVNVLNQKVFKQIRDELAQRQADVAATPREGTSDAPPVIRSKLQLSKGVDGLRTLSYEEEVVKQQEGEGAIRRFGMAGIKRKQEPRLRGLRSTFLDLLRRMDKAE